MKESLPVNHKKKYGDRITPFVWMWEAVKSGTGYKAGEALSIRTVSLKQGLAAVLDALRTAPSDFVFIHGVSDGREAEGLLCTDAVRSLADMDSAFFVGEVSDDRLGSEQAVLSACQLSCYLGSDAEYRIGYVVRNDERESDAIELTSFRDALNEVT